MPNALLIDLAKYLELWGEASMATRTSKFTSGSKKLQEVGWGSWLNTQLDDHSLLKFAYIVYPAQQV